jgi:hypothetical protein
MYSDHRLPQLVLNLQLAGGPQFLASRKGMVVKVVTATSNGEVVFAQQFTSLLVKERCSRCCDGLIA